MKQKKITEQLFLTRGWEKTVGHFLGALSRKGKIVESATFHLQYKILIEHKPDPLSTNEKQRSKFRRNTNKYTRITIHAIQHTHKQKYNRTAMTIIFPRTERVGRVQLSLYKTNIINYSAT